MLKIKFKIFHEYNGIKNQNQKPNSFQLLRLVILIVKILYEIEIFYHLIRGQKWAFGQSSENINVWNAISS